MKTEWIHKKLGDCCESELGKTLDEGRNTGLYRPYLCALNVLWGKIDISIIKQMRIEDSELERYLVKKGDLLVCEGGEIGRCAIWENDDEIYYQNALHRVRFYKEYDAYFFMYLLCHYNDLKLIEQYGKGLTIKHLNQTAFRSIPVCVPDLSAQHRIAAILSSADKVIAATQKTIAKYKQIKQGMMEELLKPKEGWKMVRLGEVYNFQYGDGNKNPNNNGDYPIYGANGIIGGYTKFNAVDSVVIGHMGEYAGSVIWANGKHFVTYNGTITTVKDNDSLYDRFGFFVLLNLDIKKICAGSGQPFLSYDTLNKIGISVPDLAEQHRIAAILSGIDAKIAAEEKVLEKYEKVKKGLMEKLLIEK